MKKIKDFIVNHKFISIIIILAVAYGIYWGYGKIKVGNVKPTYVTATAQKGTIVVSVSGSGQVSASDQVDITPKVSGNIISVNVVQGQNVKAGTLLVQIDSTDAQKTVRNAQLNLDNANLSFQKLVGIDPNAVPQNKQTAQDNLAKAYDDGFNNVSNVFLDLPSLMSGLHDVLYSYTKALSGGTQQNIDYYTDAIKIYDETALQYRDDTNTKYQTALSKYNKNFSDYKAASRFSSVSAIENLINETYDTTKSISDAVKSSTDLIQFYKDKLIQKNFPTQPTADTNLASLNTYTGQLNADLLNLSNIQSTIKTDKDAINNADLDIASQKLSLQQSQNALLDAQNTLADYSIRAPFDGEVAALNVQKGDSVSGGTVIATFITQKKMAEISLNEVDAAKVQVGQKATLTFDAINGLSLTGQVAQIDTIGTVTQGVVSYNVKIIFDTQDDRVKSGMSVSAAIITDVKQDVLLVPNAAVKSNGEQYVEILENNIPRSQTVETGLSNDTMTEITSGLKEGDKVVTQTITANTANTTQTSSQNRNAGFRVPF